MTIIFNVTTMNTQWLINGFINPTINLTKSLTYQFNINTPGISPSTFTEE